MKTTLNEGAGAGQGVACNFTYYVSYFCHRDAYHFFSALIFTDVGHSLPLEVILSHMRL